MRSHSVILGFLLLAIAGCQSVPPVPEPPLPAPPPGFAWQRIPAVKAAFLRPDGWFFTGRKLQDSHAYGISREDVARNGQFETGFTAQIITQVQEKVGMLPSAYGTRLAENLGVQPDNTVLSRQDMSQGGFLAQGMEYRHAPVVAAPMVVHKVFIANDRSGTLYIMTFEAPEAAWAAAWRKYGEVILRTMLIDDGF